MASVRGWGLFILRRIGYLIISLIGVSIITFSATRLLGNPVYLLVGTTYTKDMLENMTREMGLDRPIQQKIEIRSNAA